MDIAQEFTRLDDCSKCWCEIGKAGVFAFDFQRLAGHSSIIISQRYVHPTPERRESAITAMSAVQ
jgi:hypothetical protein